MDANLRQQILFEKNDGRDQLFGLIQSNNSQIVPKNGLLYVQVVYKYIVNFTSEIYKLIYSHVQVRLSVFHKCSFCLIVILAVIL